MKVPVDVDDLAMLLDAAQATFSPPLVPVVARVGEELARARHNADHPVATLTVDEDGVLQAVDRLGRVRSRWVALQPAVAILSALVDDHPGNVFQADQLGSYVRDQLDDLGVAVTDEDALYVVLIALALVTTLTRNGYRAGTVDGPTLAAVAHVVRSIVAALIPFLPPEARP